MRDARLVAPASGDRRRAVAYAVAAEPAPTGGARRLRYVVFLFVAITLLLAVGSLLRRGRGRARPVPVAIWPWFLVPVVIALVVAFGAGLKRWALD